MRIRQGAHLTRMLNLNLESGEMRTRGSTWRFAAQQDTSLLTPILQCRVTNSLYATLGVHCTPNVGARSTNCHTSRLEKRMLYLDFGLDLMAPITKSLAFGQTTRNTKLVPDTSSPRGFPPPAPLEGSTAALARSKNGRRTRNGTPALSTHHAKVCFDLKADRRVVAGCLRDVDTSLFHQLDEKNLAWSVYADNRVFEQRMHPTLHRAHRDRFKSIAQFYEDAGSGNLPAHAWDESNTSSAFSESEKSTFANRL